MRKPDTSAYDTRSIRKHHDWIDTVHGIWQADLTRFLLLCVGLGLAAGWFANTTIESWRWGDVPSWVAAVGTVTAVSVALWQSNAERRRRLLQEHRAQAELISAWFDGEVVLRNMSEQPVYEVVTHLVVVQGAGPRRGEDSGPDPYRWVHNILPPGTWVGEVPHGWGGMSLFPGVEVSFSDRTGHVHWIRRVDGVLEEISRPAVEHYGIARPVGYQPLLPIGDRPANGPA